MRDLGVVELLFTSDGQVALEKSRALRPAKDVLLTVNFQTEKGGLKKLLTLQVCVCAVCVAVHVCVRRHVLWRDQRWQTLLEADVRLLEQHLPRHRVSNTLPT